jgi:thioesterase domain-containing protein
VVRLNDGPDDRPMLFFHAIGGTVYPYGHLARELEEDYRVSGVPFPDGHADSGLSLDALLQRHLAVVRGVQPEGPYRLAGWSMGGILAFEIARRLQVQGEVVAVVGLLDTPFWLPDDPEPSDGEFAGLFVADAARSLGPVHSSRPDPRAATADEQLHWLSVQLDACGEPQRMRPELARRYATFRTNTRILAGYRPTGTLTSDALIVHVQESPNTSSRWLDVILGTATQLSVKGNHYTFLQPPLVSQVAAAMRETGR